MDVKMNQGRKKGQITIFIIIALFIVFAIVLFFILKGREGVEVFGPSFPEPQEYIEKCTKDATIQVIEIILPQAGYIQPTNYLLYENNRVAYLCYNKNFYQACVNQEPLYIQHLEEEIKSYIEPRIKDCFYALKQEYQDRNYDVDDGPLNLDVELNPKQVKINIEKIFEIRRGEESKRYDRFRAKVSSPIYDLACLSQEIVSQEAKFCNFEYLGYILLYPEFDVDKKAIGSGLTSSKIYVIKDRYTGKALYIAVRSCAIPPGF